MKNLRKTLATTAILSMMVTFGAMAQSSSDSTQMKHPHQMKAGGKMMAKLSEDQKAMMKANREMAKSDMEAFKATLTADQKKIMEDKSLNPKERIKALEKTLNADQKAMWKKNQEVRKEREEKFRATLTPEQKEAMKEKGHQMMKARRGSKPTPASNS
ncbi:MAG: hypothetical protein IE931_08210 [Sphingobacteriales bacterium]|nr:hypothetical protein [Sphingobacteriales bacterium]